MSLAIHPKSIKGQNPIFPFIGYLAMLLCAMGCTPKPEKSAETPAPAQKEAVADTPYRYEGKPLRIGVVGLSHDHVHGILGRPDYGDIEIVGIVESDTALIERLRKRYHFNPDIVFPTMEEMAEAVHPEAVAGFNPIYDHLAIVECFAPKGVHIMVEKPLAVSTAHADKMIALAKKHNVRLMTNFETTWYGSNQKAYDMVHHDSAVGPIRKIVFRTGHEGPKEIGCSKEFLSWLTDPVLNGAGALTDFGCYGANLATWLMHGETPETVSCITQHIKPDVYPKVEDEATILLTYPKAQVIIQASWNWPYSRKNMSLYGKTGYVECLNGTDMRIMTGPDKEREEIQAEPLPQGAHDPFAYLVNTIRGDLRESPFAPSSMENNKITVQILEAAKEAARTGKTLSWKELYGS